MSNKTIQSLWRKNSSQIPKMKKTPPDIQLQGISEQRCNISAICMGFIYGGRRFWFLQRVFLQNWHIENSTIFEVYRLSQSFSLVSKNKRPSPIHTRVQNLCCIERKFLNWVADKKSTSCPKFSAKKQTDADRRTDRLSQILARLKLRNWEPPVIRWRICWQNNFL